MPGREGIENKKIVKKKFNYKKMCKTCMQANAVVEFYGILYGTNTF